MLENREIEEVKKEDPDVDSIWMTFFSRRWRTAGEGVCHSVWVQQY